MEKGGEIAVTWEGEGGKLLPLEIGCSYSPSLLYFLITLKKGIPCDHCAWIRTHAVPGFFFSFRYVSE